MLIYFEFNSISLTNRSKELKKKKKVNPRKMKESQSQEILLITDH
jgi:hypothetical protein